MKSKTKIDRQMQKKTNVVLVNTIKEAKKYKSWIKVASILSGPRRKRPDVNLEEIDKKSKLGDILVIPGKVLSQGEITKKIRIVALGFSDKAKEKLLKSKSEISTIVDEIKKNPDAKAVKIIEKW